MTITQRYFLTPTDASSKKYGNCEVCGEPASEVFIQTTHQKTTDGWKSVSGVFGHDECLRSKHQAGEAVYLHTSGYHRLHVENS